jgi:hypothetical protein
MSLGTTTTFAANESSVIQSALRKLGQLGDWETLNTTDTRYVNARFVLNSRIKSLMAEGMPLWKMTDVIVDCSTLTTGTTTIGPTDSGSVVTSALGQPLKIERVTRKDTNTNTEVEVSLIPYNQYKLYPQKLSLATPTQLAFIPGRITSSIYVFAAPDTYWQTYGQLSLRVQVPYTDMTGVNDDIDFPSYWHEAVVYQLAVALAPEYGLAPNDRQTLRLEAEQLKQTALGFGGEDTSVFFQPDRRWRR